MPHRYPFDHLRRLAVGFTLWLVVQPVIAQPVMPSVMSAAAAFSGKLVYTNGSRDYPVTITYLQNKNLGRVTEQAVEMGDDNRQFGRRSLDHPGPRCSRSADCREQ